MYQSMNSFQSTGTFNQVSETSQKIQLFLSGRNLLDLDFFSKSDPYVKVYFKGSPLQKQTFLGKTQTIDNDLNPNWHKTFTLDYIFQTKQQIRFEVFDSDSQNGQDDDFIGRAVTTIGSLAGAKHQTSILDLVNKDSKCQKLGKLIIRVEPLAESNQYLRMKWKAKKLMNTDSFFDFWDKSDPYLKFLKIRSDNTLIETARTQIIMDDLNPDWKQIQVPMSRLISTQDLNSKFKIQCWDWQEKGENKHQFIGQMYLTLSEMQTVKKLPMQYKLFNPKCKKPGKILLEDYEIITRPTFLDYLRGGLQLNLSIAIDFTGSNGNPTSSSSLHYMNPIQPNNYQVAIDAVSRILLDYDSDKRIPAFGFGAKTRFQNLSSFGSVSHCFPLSGSMEQIQAFGYQHLMNMYANAIQNVQLSGPTYFAPILRQAVRLSQKSMQQGSNVYQVLLILTDGEIHDMPETVDILVNNCNLPLSIIIVGIGNAEFSKMVRLDGDNGLYSDQGKKAPRDIVQFVPFRQVKMNPDLLAKQLLEELPSQVTQYYSMIGRKPGPPLQADVSLMMEQKKAQEQLSPQQALKQNLKNLFLQQQQQ